MTSRQDPYDMLLERLRAQVQSSPGASEPEGVPAAGDPKREDRLRKMAQAIAAGDLETFSSLVTKPDQSLVLNREGDEDDATVPELDEERQRVKEELDERDDLED